MPWWKRTKPDDADLNAALRREELRQQLYAIRERNADAARADYAKQRQAEREWQKTLWKPAPPNPAFPIREDDGLLKRVAKGVINRKVYDVQIDLHKWNDDREARRQERAQEAARARAKAEQAAQARRTPQPPPLPPEPTPVIHGDGFTMRRDDQPASPNHTIFGNGPAAPEPSAAPRRGPRR
jgi:hypothetical protein